MSANTREHIVSTRAKLSDQDSIALFDGFLRGDAEQVLADIITRRVDEATTEARELDRAELDTRVADLRAEMDRQLTAIERRLRELRQARAAVARGRRLASEWLEKCPGGPHSKCKGARLVDALELRDSDG